MKKAEGRIVLSSYRPDLVSIRGPKGRGANDSIREHLTQAGFKDGDEVVVILKTDLPDANGVQYDLKENTSQRYFLDNDDDGHWYVVPVDKKKEFYRWIDSYEDKMPEGVISLGCSPSSVTFGDPKDSYGYTKK